MLTRFGGDCVAETKRNAEAVICLMARHGDSSMSGMRGPVAVIIGMMGAGKTRVGKEVAQMMNLPFADADNEIEHDAGMVPSTSKVWGTGIPELETTSCDMLESFDGIFFMGGERP